MYFVDDNKSICQKCTRFFGREMPLASHPVRCWCEVRGHTIFETPMETPTFLEILLKAIENA